MSTFIEKKGIIIITIITLAFLVTALNNLGSSEVPTTTMRMSKGDVFVIELGVSRIVDSAMILIKQGDITLNILTGSPNNWDIGVSKLIQGYYTGRRYLLERSRATSDSKPRMARAHLSKRCFL